MIGNRNILRGLMDADSVNLFDRRHIMPLKLLNPEKAGWLMLINDMSCYTPAQTKHREIMEDYMKPMNINRN